MSYISSQRRIYIAVFIVLGLLIGFHYIGWLKPVENFFYRVIVPSATEAHTLSVKIGDQYQFFANKNDFLTKYAACTLEVANDQVEKAKTKELEDENAELKKQLHYVQSQKNSTILATVVGREIAGAEKTIIIDTGTGSGVSVGQPVISGEGMLVGKIIRVEERVAMVRLINDPSSKVEVGVTNTDHSIGVIEGGYGITLKMKFVPRNEVVKVDDQIITSGYEPLIPRGLVLGKIAEVQNQASQGFQDISVVPLVDVNKLTHVSVLLTQK